MKNKLLNLIKYSIILLLLSFLLLQLSGCSYSPTGSTAQQLAGSGSTTQQATVLPAFLATAIKVVVTAIQVAGTGIAVIMLTWTAIRYFTAAAASDKAALNNTLITWTITAVLLVLVPQLIIMILNNVF